MNAEHDVVVAEGAAPNGDRWAVLYRPELFGDRHYLALLVNGGIQEDGAGFDIPGTTEIGFGGGLTPGVGNYYLYGLTSARIHAVRAECLIGGDQSEVKTAPFPAATGDDGSELRTFVMVRPPVGDVTALVGLDRNGGVVQRIRL